jgi:hypothetical protein
MPAKSTNLIYQLKVSLRGSKPPIWRRLLVPGSITLHQLHQIIEIAMGWEGGHLHQFIIEDEYYGIPSSEDWEPVMDESRIHVNKIAPAEKSKFIYVYDFGDNWEHEILVEKILLPETGIKYPLCIKGKRACPPDDVGGVWGYMEFVEAMRDPNHAEHDFYAEWWGDDFNPEEFDIEGVNKVLERIK